MVCSKTHKDLVLAQTCAWHFGLRIRAVCGGARRKAVQGRSGPGQVRMTGRLELDRTHIHRGSVVKSWPKFCKVRDCGVCRARRSRGGLFPLAYFAFKGDWPEFANIWNSARNSQNFNASGAARGGSAPPLTPPAAPRRLDLRTPAREGEIWFVLE